MADLKAAPTTPPPFTAGAAHLPTDATRRIQREPGKADRDPGRHARNRRTLELSLAILFPIAFILLWQLAATQGWIDRVNFPAPSDIVAEMRKSFRANPKGNWWIDVWASTKRLLWGYLWGVLSGLLFGVVMGMSRTIRAMLEPTLNALYTVPKLALISVFLIVFGFGDEPLIVIVAVTVFFFVWIQCMAAVMSVSTGYREAAKSFGSSPWQMFRHVLLPASLPDVIVGLRVAAGVGVLTIIGAELVFPPKNQGIGYRINFARQVNDPKQAYVGLVVAAIFGVVFITVVKRLGKILVPWAQEDNATNQG